MHSALPDRFPLSQARSHVFGDVLPFDFVRYVFHQFLSRNLVKIRRIQEIRAIGDVDSRSVRIAVIAMLNGIMTVLDWRQENPYNKSNDRCEEK